MRVPILRNISTASSPHYRSTDHVRDDVTDVRYDVRHHVMINVTGSDTPLSINDTNSFSFATEGGLNATAGDGSYRQRHRRGSAGATPRSSRVRMNSTEGVEDSAQSFTTQRPSSGDPDSSSHRRNKTDNFRNTPSEYFFIPYSINQSHVADKGSELVQELYRL